MSIVMNKRDRMMSEIETGATSHGHKLRPWTKGRWGFHTTCCQCGAFVAITVSRGAKREGDRLEKQCEGNRREP